MPIHPVAIFVALPIVGLIAFGVYFMSASWAEESARVGDSGGAVSEGAGYSWFFTVATWSLALLYIGVGVPKLSALSDLIHQFTEQWGYSEGFMYVIGALEFVSGILLLIPRIRLVAAVVLSVIMTGAIYTHLAFDPAPMVLVPTGCLALSVFVGTISYRREWRAE